MQPEIWAAIDREHGKMIFLMQGRLTQDQYEWVSRFFYNYEFKKEGPGTWTHSISVEEEKYLWLWSWAFRRFHEMDLPLHEMPLDMMFANRPEFRMQSQNSAVEKFLGFRR